MRWNSVLKGSVVAAIVACLPALCLAGNPHQVKARPASPTTTTTTDATSIVVDQGGYPNAVGVDAFGRPCAAYFKGNELRFAVNDGTSWKVQTVGPVGGDYGASVVSMAVDGQGHPGVAYYVSYDGGITVNRIGFAFFDGVAWKVETIDRNGFSPSMTFTAANGWAVAYVKFDGVGNVLNLAENSGSGWRISTVDASARSAGVSGGVRGPSIATDRLGNVGISYGYDIPAISKEVRYAYRAEGLWKISKILATDVATVTSVAFDSSNRPYVGYWARVSGSLNISASNGIGGWVNSVVPWAGTGSAGQISLAMDPTDTAFMSAFDNGSADLHLVSGRTGSFSSQILASSGAVGRSNSLTVSSASGQKCLTFSDQSLGVLKFRAF